MLVAGSPFKEWAAGKSSARKIALAGDFTSLVTLSGGKVKTRLALNSLLRCDLGRGAAHAKKKMLSSTKVPGGKADACFVIKGLAENDVLCGECNSRADAVALKDALNAPTAVRRAVAASASKWVTTTCDYSKTRGPWCGRGCPALGVP